MTKKPFNPFRAALGRLYDGVAPSPGPDKDMFICLALNNLSHLHPEHISVLQAAKYHVRKCLAPATVLEEWLEFSVDPDDIFNVIKDSYGGKGQQAYQAHRKAWLEKLAGEYDRGEIQL